MGWSWRKSENIGPFRINLSSGGIGYSVGGRGFHVGVNARGRKYVSAGLPGTGLRYNSSLGRGGALGCLSMILLPILCVTMIFAARSVCPFVPGDLAISANDSLPAFVPHLEHP